jgi:hypothetical protein
VAFDLDKRICYRRALSFHSRYGQVMARPEDLISPTPPPE